MFKMSNEDSIEIRQENEIEALKAIFGDELRDLRAKTAWNLWNPLNLTITLTPQQGGSGVQEVHAKVDLHIICSKNYPNEIPKMQLENSRGMSKPILEELLANLHDKAKELVGEVMIFELAQYTQLFLHQHNKPGFKSFYEEMLTRQKELELQLQQAQQEEKDRERQVILNEIQQRQKKLKSESRHRRERFNTENSDDSQGANKRNYSANRKYSNSYSSIEQDEQDICSCEHKGTQIIEFTNNGVREIQRGRCTSHSHDGSVIHYNGLDIETGELFAIGEWTISTKNNDNTLMQRQISSIEQEMNYLVKLKHPNLAHYVNMKHQFVSSENKAVVYILQEFVVGLNCSSFLSENFPVDADMLRHISRGILNVLEFLHRNNVVHKEIIESCIYLNSNGVVKVANYSIYKRLSDLISQCHYLSSYNKKTDIFKFGILILSFIRGASISDDSTEIPSTVPLDFYDFLTKCLAKEEKERFTAAQLLNHPFIRVPLERLSPQRTVDEITNVQNISPEPTVVDLKTLAQSNSMGQSRVQSEFEVMQWIGKGAFGDVLKVRNKLDGGQYAIKRIELNPKNKQLNRKITREVKLLSKLNHENVVRYYNAWIESAIIENDDTDSSKTDSSNIVPNIPKVIQQKELTFKNDIEMLAPPIKDVEWSISYESKSKPGTINGSSSDDGSSEDDDEDEEWGVMLNVDSSDSDSIEFERDGASTIDSESSAEVTPTKNETEVPNSPISRIREIQFLYIQMEFCEKSTLRTAIDADLCSDSNRIWRLFREIIEGLAHIHQQGMIHRDLKPVNIFLDLNDHVKIGDFGLATTNILSKSVDSANSNKNTQENEKDAWSHEGAGDGSLTGQVGTALYTAPELSSVTKTVYNQKVDIYSLGIILFEMCYTPLKTQMERMKILGGLRTREIIFPANITEKDYHKKEILIRWLLNHDVSKRPTSQELLQSELVPPPVLEEEKLREMFRHTLNNPQFKAYKYLIASCFEQPITLAQDITYHDTSLTVPSFVKSLPIFHYVKQTVINIFKLHGGQNLSTPLFMPKNTYYEATDSCVKLMTHSGSIVSVPHDLRVPFARYVAWNAITLLRRYSIERVYRENKVFGYHPRELYECAFDIVTPNTGNLMSDAEVLYMMNEIINELPGLKNKNVLIRLNHTSLIQAILLHCGIKEQHNEVFGVLSKAKEGKVTKFDVKDLLIRLGLSDNSIDTFFHLLGLENSLTKILSTLQMITKKKSSEASVLAKQGLQDLKVIVQNTEALGVSFNIIITPGLIYNVTQYSGMMCQFVCELKKKRRRGGMDVLAAGGRYDAMIASYRDIKEQGNTSNKDVRQSAVGISISLDKLVQAVQQEGGSEICNIGNLDVVVCSLGSKALIREKARILKELWSAGVHCTLIEATNLEEIQEQCTELNVPHVIMLKDTEQGTVRIRSWERDRFQEKVVSISDLVENMQRVIKLWNEGYQEQTASILSTRSEKIINTCEHPHEAVVSVLFITSEKLSSNARRRYENQIKSQLDTTFKRLSGDVMVLGLNIEDNVIRTLASYLDFESEQLYQKSIKTVVERHQRHKKYLMEVCDEIYDQKSKRTNPILVLYSITDSFYKLIL